MFSDGSFKFPCVPVPFDVNGPYSINLSDLDSDQRLVWVNSCNAPATTHKMSGWDHLYHSLNVHQPALLVHRGWACIMLYDEPNGLALLQEAQALVGLGRDKLFDDHVQRLNEHVEKLRQDHDKAWDQLEDQASHFWLRKWDVVLNWNLLKNTLTEEEAVKRYNRLLCLQTNQLEGLFRLHAASISRLVRIGFFPPAVEVLQEGTLYFEIADEAQSKVAQVCEDILKAIGTVVSMSEGNIPIDIDGVKKIHFESTFHSRFICTDPGPPAIYAIISPGTFRQGVCSTIYEVGEKIGVVQYCNFRQVPDQMEKMMGLFNQYLSTLAPASPIAALRLAAWSHAWFGEIHPFGDGNGRVGRLLSSIPLLRCGLPPINIMGSTTLDAAKTEYVDALVKAQYNDDLAPLIIVILKGMLESLRYIQANCLEEEKGVVEVCSGSANDYSNNQIIHDAELQLQRNSSGYWNVIVKGARNVQTKR